MSDLQIVQFDGENARNVGADSPPRGRHPAEPLRRFRPVLSASGWRGSRQHRFGRATPSPSRVETAAGRPGPRFVVGAGGRHGAESRLMGGSRRLERLPAAPRHRNQAGSHRVDRSDALFADQEPSHVYRSTVSAAAPAVIADPFSNELTELIDQLRQQDQLKSANPQHTIDTAHIRASILELLSRPVFRYKITLKNFARMHRLMTNTAVSFTSSLVMEGDEYSVQNPMIGGSMYTQTIQFGCSKPVAVCKLGTYFTQRYDDIDVRFATEIREADKNEEIWDFDVVVRSPQDTASQASSSDPWRHRGVG